MADLNIILGEYNIELARIGFSKRLPNQLQFIGTENSAMNKYMVYSLRRLNGRLQNGDSKGYWAIVKHLLRNSISFRVSAINKVLPN